MKGRMECRVREIIRQVNNFGGTWKRKFPEDRGWETATKMNFLPWRFGRLPPLAGLQNDSQKHISKVISEKKVPVIIQWCCVTEISHCILASIKYYNFSSLPVLCRKISYYFFIRSSLLVRLNIFIFSVNYISIFSCNIYWLCKG